MLEACMQIVAAVAASLQPGLMLRSLEMGKLIALVAFYGGLLQS